VPSCWKAGRFEPCGPVSRARLQESAQNAGDALLPSVTQRAGAGGRGSQRMRGRERRRECPKGRNLPQVHVMEG